jgi:hypothetical protein
MASNFAFQPMGLSRAVTVGGAAPTTFSIAVTQLGGVSFKPPSSLRVVNDGTAAVFLQFGAATGSTLSVNATTGMKMLSASVETFGIKGLPFLAAACASTFTVKLCVSPGEGM